MTSLLLRWKRRLDARLERWVRTWVSGFGGLLLAGGLWVHIHEAIVLEGLATWGVLSGLGVLVVLLASLLERRRARPRGASAAPQ